MGMRGIGVGMQGIEVRMRGTAGGNEEDQGENFCISMEKMNKKYGEG